MAIVRRGGWRPLAAWYAKGLSAEIGIDGRNLIGNCRPQSLRGNISWVMEVAETIYISGRSEIDSANYANAVGPNVSGQKSL